MFEQKGRWRLFSLALAFCFALLLPWAGALNFEGETVPEFEGGTAQEEDVELFWGSELGFYIDDKVPEDLHDPDNHRSFIYDQAGDNWTYAYNRSEKIGTLTLKNGFRHGLAVYDSAFDYDSGGRVMKQDITFEIAVEGTATITSWATFAELDPYILATRCTIEVSGGQLNVDTFEKSGGSMEFPLMAAKKDGGTPGSITINNGVSLGSGFLWVQGGNITIKRGTEAQRSVEGAPYLLSCYVSNEFGGTMILDGQGEPAARFNLSGRMNLYKAKEEPEQGTSIFTGLEMENTVLTDQKGNRLYIGSVGNALLGIFHEDGTEADYVIATNSLNALDRTKPVQIRFTGADGETVLEQTVNAGTDVVALPAYTGSAPKGKKFSGWKIGSQNANGEQPGTKWVFPGAATVEPVWKDRTDISVRMRHNNPTDNVEILKVSQGRLPYLPYPVYNGYEFTGWYTAKEGGTEITLEDEFWENTTVYAHWKPASSNTSGTLHGTGISWELANGTVSLTGTGALPMFVSYPPWAYKSVTAIHIGSGISGIMHSAFDSCGNLERIEADPGNPEYTTVDGVLFSNGGKSLCVYPAGHTDSAYTVPAGTETIEGYAFQGSKLVQVTIPSGVKVIPNYAFYQSEQLEEVVLGEGLEEIRHHAFGGCVSLRVIDFPSSMRNIEGSAFYGCDALESIVIPDWANTFSDSAFINCKNLKCVVLGKGISSLDIILQDEKTELTTFVVSDHIGKIDGSTFTEKFPKVTDLYYCGSKGSWEMNGFSAPLPATVHVHTDDWQAVLSVEPVSRGTFVRAAYHKEAPAKLVAAAYDSSGKMIAAQTEDVSGSANLSFVLPVQKDRCAKISLYALDTATQKPLMEDVEWVSSNYVQ